MLKHSRLSFGLVASRWESKLDAHFINPSSSLVIGE